MSLTCRRYVAGVSYPTNDVDFRIRRVIHAIHLAVGHGIIQGEQAHAGLSLLPLTNARGSHAAGRLIFAHRGAGPGDLGGAGAAVYLICSVFTRELHLL